MQNEITGTSYIARAKTAIVTLLAFVEAMTDSPYSDKLAVGNFARNATQLATDLRFAKTADDAQAIVADAVQLAADVRRFGDLLGYRNLADATDAANRIVADVLAAADAAFEAVAA